MKPASVSGGRIDKNVEIWSNAVGDKLGKAEVAYNSAKSALECCRIWWSLYELTTP